ncbi:MAG: TlpA family protein disulfide reductase [Woeseiaceae bacterium]
MRLAIALLSLNLLMCSSVAVAQAAPVNLGKAPDWTLNSADGSSVTLSETVADQPVVLLFWATWCPFCKALMPHLQSIRLEYGEDVKILALHFRDDKGDPIAFIRDAGYDFTLLQNSNDVADLYKVWATPGVIVIDQDMQMRFNLYKLPKIDPPNTGKAPSHITRAAFRAPYWAAEIRKTLREIEED